jgi:4-amino-4-deoxy-L-arabinose transferase-like glycosyltransferase
MPSNLAIKSPMKFLKDKFSVSCLLTTVFCLGGFLRFFNLNWDQGHFFHPDERNIAAAVSRIQFFDQLNPKFFAYGSFPIYLYRIVGEAIAIITGNNDWVYDWGKINLVSRGVSAFFSSLTIILVFLVAKKIWNRKVGFIASLLTAFTVSLIQTAHYGVTESLLVFWLMLILLLSLQLLEKQRLKDYIKIGLIMGLATATKVSALSLTVIPLMSHLLVSIQDRKRFKYLNYQMKLLISALVSLVTFIIISPYTFLDRVNFLESMNYESGVATGRLKVVYVLQFEKTLPYLFQLKNLIWQVGPVVLLGYLGLLLLAFIAIKKKNKKAIVFVSFPLVYFIYVGSWYTKFIRYMVPLIPFLIITASWLIFEVQKKWQSWGSFLMVIALGSSLFWSLAFFSIYTKESTRITASRWIYQNLPKDSKILGEHWDDGLPITLNNDHPSQYQIEQLTIYEPDNSQKVEYYAQKLSQADYIIINSRRLYGTLVYLPEKYPITAYYYQLLFSGQLGYQKIAEFSSYPSIFGLEINDDKTEETFQVYEHPKIILFKNDKKFTQNDLEKILKL